MNNKIKIGLLILFIVVFFILLKIRKKEREHNLLSVSSLYKTIELFEGPFVFKIEEFRTFHSDKEPSPISFPTLSISSLITGFTPHKKEGTGENEIYYLGPNGVCFDTRNDDLIVFDIYRLRRFHCRPDRILSTTTTQPTLKLNIEEVELRYDKNTVILINYLKKLRELYDFMEPVTENNIKKSYDLTQKFLASHKGDFKVTIQESEIETLPGKDKKYEIKEYTDKDSYKVELDNLYWIYDNELVKKEKCYDNSKNCALKYQRDMPPFELGNLGRGIHQLQYDDNSQTIFHPNRVNDIIRKENNEWHNDKKGIFQPQTSHLGNSLKLQSPNKMYLTTTNTVKSGFLGGKVSGDGKHTKVEYVEPFVSAPAPLMSIPESGYMNAYIKSKYMALFKLSDEFENIGVGMYYQRESKSVFVPDCLNNRIQVFQCLDDDFVYQGQFGNLDFTSHRSLPNYKDETDTHKGTPMIYEPLVDTSEHTNIGKYACDGAVIKDKFNMLGPFSGSGTSCELAYNVHRFDIHSRNMLQDETLKDIKIGHFNNLSEEYDRVNNFNGKEVTDFPNYDNPHHIGFELDSAGNPVSEADGVSQKTLAYRKLLYKNIKITDEGQKFGQLFRPKSVAFDDDNESKNGGKYYVVDTYHHCIQCFEEDGEIQTTDGKEITFKSADEKLNDDISVYLYDRELNVGDYVKYNNSNMYSLGVRQKLLFDNNKVDGTLLATHNQWFQDYGQQINGSPGIKLFRWLSGSTKYSNASFGNADVDVDYNDIVEYSFNTPLMKDTNRKGLPGLGEFLFPSDIAISRNPFNQEQLLMVTDMGNNRVSIFKKQKLPSGNYRFRFYRFLNDDSRDIDKIKNPLSITVSKNTGTVYVLNGDFYDTKQTISIFRPTMVNNQLKYIYIKDIEVTGRATRIRVDDRGFLVITDCADKGKIHIEKVDDLVIPFTLETEQVQVRLNSVYFNIKPSNRFDKSTEEIPDNINRFRLLLGRQNMSKGETKLDIIMSPEYKLDYKFLENNKLDKANMNLNYTIEDSYNMEDFEEYWVQTNNNSKDKIEVDLVDYITKPNKVYVSKKDNFNVNKNYRDVEIYGNQCQVLDNYEDWVGKGLTPNTTYNYTMHFYNYYKSIEIRKDIKVTTMPIGLKSNEIGREFISVAGKEQIVLRMAYGSLSELHYKTQKYNPLYYYIFRKEHNRSRDIASKYLDIDKTNLIQIVVPRESKYIHSKFSQPKFGKLYIFNAYGKGNVIEQNILMSKEKYYDSEHQIIYYSANGGIRGEGGFPIPHTSSLGENTFIDDFFTIGDDPQNIHRKIKFRVRINLDKDGKNEIIELTNPENIKSIMPHYSRDKGINEHSMVLVKKFPAFNKDYSYKSEVEFKDQGPHIKSNKTYEYCVLVGNHKQINPAGNSFYLTTKPAQPLFDGLENVKLTHEGQNKLYLKVEWYTPKDEDIYWPFNFLLMRRKEHPDNMKRPLLLEGSSKQNKDFDIQNGKIRVKSSNPVESVTYIHQFKNKLGDYKLSFNIYGKDIDSTTTKDTTYISSGKEQTFTWKPSENSIDLPKSINVVLKVPLKKGQTLEKIKLEETVIFDNDTKILSDFNKEELDRKKKKKKELDNWNKMKDKEDREMFLKENKRRQELSSLGEVFMLDDDYQDVERSNYGGYGGELFHYLQKKDKTQLLEIFDALHDKILVYHGDITMKMEGPSGMLRSGSVDMLIDKIRYMSLLLRREQSASYDTMGIECDPENIKDLLKGKEGSSDQRKCMSRKQKEIDNKIKKLQEQKDAIQAEVDAEEKRKKELVEEQKQLQAQLLQADEAAKRKLDADIEQLTNNIKEEEAKLNANKELKEKRDKLKALQNESTKQTDPTRNKIPENIEDLVKGPLKDFRESLSLESVLKDKFYQGNYGGFYGEKIKINLMDFLKDLRTGVLTKALIREEYKKMKNMIYDYSTSDLYFVKPGESVEENIGNVVHAPNFIIITIGDERKSLTEFQEAKEDEFKELNDDKLKALQEELENKKKLLIKDGKEKELETDPDIQRLKKLQEKIKENNKVGISDWSYLKQGKEELFTRIIPTDEEKSKIMEDYAIIPTLSKLSGKRKTGLDFFKDQLIDDRTEKILEKKEYIAHKQLIEISGTDNTKYEYCIGTFQTGLGFNTDEKRSFMGMNYMTKIITDKKEQMPILNVGENYSDIIAFGTEIVNVLPDIPPPAEVFSHPPAETIPIIKSFSPKEGLQGSIVKVMGIDLDKIEYFCFRDIKAEIVRKGKNYVVENKKNVIYDEYLLRVPMLKELGKECWQSVRPYEVLLWGYYKGGGSQIRTSEVESIMDNDSDKISRVLMFRYMDRIECPEDEKLDIPQ